MRSLFFCAAIGVALAGTAAADTIDVPRENTLLLHKQSGESYSILIKEGSQLEQVNPTALCATGFWRMETDKGFCWTARGAATLCIPMPSDKLVGDRREIKGPVGQLVWTAEIQEGRADLRVISASNLVQ